MEPQVTTPVEQVAPRTNGKARSLEFSKSLEVAIKLSNAEGEVSHLQWALGDALLEEVGPPGPDGVKNKSGQRLQRAVECFGQHGLNYTVAHLRDLRTVANAFAPADRSEGIGWSLHRAAGSPELLQQAKEAADTTGESLTVKFIREFKKERDRKNTKKNRKNANLDDRPEANAALIKALENYRKGIITVQDRLADNQQIIKPHLAELSNEDRAVLLSGVNEVRASLQRIEQMLQPDTHE